MKKAGIAGGLIALLLMLLPVCSGVAVDRGERKRERRSNEPGGRLLVGHAARGCVQAPGGQADRATLVCGRPAASARGVPPTRCGVGPAIGPLRGAGPPDLRWRTAQLGGNQISKE